MKLIGIDLGGTKISAGLVVNGKVTKIITEATNTKSATTVIKQIIDIVQRLGLNGVKAIGIGVPSIVDTARGIVYEVTNIPSWKKVPLGDKLQKTFGIPVYINNDANCFVLGEKYFGKAKQFQNVVGLTIGTGLGTGIVIDGKIYNGRNCGAGEICNIPYQGQTLEYYCSGNFFGKRGSEIFKKAQTGDTKAKKIFADFGVHVGSAIAICALAYDPEIVVIGGSVTESYKYFQKTMLQTLKSQVYQQTYKNLKIAVSTNKDSAILGSASLCLDH